MAEPAEPLRNREATITGAASGVKATTIWKCSPLTFISVLGPVEFTRLGLLAVPAALVPAMVAVWVSLHAIGG